MSRRARLAASTGTDRGSPGHPSSRLDTKPSSPREHHSLRPAHAATAVDLSSTPHERGICANGVWEGLGCLGLPICVMKLLSQFQCRLPGPNSLGAGSCPELSREAAEAVDPQDCPDSKPGSTGSAGHASGWPCPVC